MSYARTKIVLIKQKYPEQIMDHGLEKAMALDNDLLRRVKAKSNEDITP